MPQRVQEKVTDQSPPQAEKRVLVGRYRIDGSLGRGGMSEVFVGYDERLDRRVAIKLLRPPSVGADQYEPNSPEAVAVLDSRERDRKRFLREIRTTARLEHPGAPAVYDSGVEVESDGTSTLWLVMQLLRGSTLESVLDAADFEVAPPSFGWAAAIAAQVAAVLADVHRVDIVHRDIKPANVMIVDGGLVKVLDFGIAILRGAAALPRLTQVDRTVGTPAYMSPEQCLGQVVTATSDIYSLGCLLCELLTGDVPFHATYDTSLRAHHLQTAAPSMRPRRSDIPLALDRLVTSMLNKNPRLRPSAVEVYETLLPFVSESASSVDDRDPTRPFRKPLLITAPRRDAASGRSALTSGEFEQLKANVGVLLDNDRPAEAIRLLEGAIERTGDDAVMGLRLRHFLGAALFYAGEYTRAASLLDAAGRDYRRHLLPNDAYVLDCAYHAGHAYAATGKPESALPHLRFYVQNADPNSNVDEAQKILESRFVIAQMLVAVGDPDDAGAELRELRPLFVTMFGTESIHVRNIDKEIRRLGQDGSST
ncbi:protein kinase [Mycobacterium sp. pUA109]|uniref:protein kinase domain-containing protein n=1 Tax=Mycobacterium sp. pUA109 TaxID=3238982 RepID=UPI00351B47EB